MGRRLAAALAVGLFAAVAVPSQTVVAARPAASVPAPATAAQSRQIGAAAPERSTTTAPAVGMPLTFGGSWSWQYPSSNGNALRAISCPTAAVCFAGSASGPILMTANGGSTWTQQAWVGGVNGISCLTYTVCVAVADNAVIRTTTNEGAFWGGVPFNGTGYLAAVSCPQGASYCLAAGFAGSMVRIDPFQGTPTTLYSGQVANLFGISCPSASVCYAVGAGGLIIGTADAGNTWNAESSTTTQPLYAISCHDTSNCAAVGAQGTIVSTTNGGTSWAFIGSETRADLLGISCPAVNTCFSAGNDGEVHAGFSLIYGNSSVGADGRLLAISCPTVTECLTAGDYGTVALTTNGGSGWSQQISGLPNTVAGVSCPTTTVCFAVNQHSILGTTNGGTNWSTLQTSSSFFNAISCPGPMTCFAVGGSSSVGTPMIYMTTDGFTHWNPVLGQANPQDEVNSISCATPKFCVVVLNHSFLARTSDGATWTSFYGGPCGSTCGTINQVSCPSVSVCFLALGTTPGQIYASADGGATWTLSFDIANDPQGGGGNGFTAISCPSTLVCYAVGPGPASPGPGGAYATTTDGGVTWRTDFGPSSTDVRGISCPSVSTCYVAATGSSIFHTSDFGLTWDVQLGNVNAWYWSISCPSTTTCFAGGSAGTAGAIISNTTTAGAAWTRPQPAGSTASIQGIDCGSATDCYAAALKTVLVSHNGGSNWAVHTLVNGDSLNAVKCVSATTCYAVGWPGAIYKTIDGGTSWTYSPNPLSAQDTTLLGVSCWSNTACVAVGTVGDVLSTVDGSTWTLEASTTTENLFGVSCPNSSTCVAVGSNGTAVTRSGGSWSAGASGTTAGLSGVSCPTATTCYAVGLGGTLIVTNNQGATWTAQNSGVTNHLLGIACIRTTYCLAVGSGGAATATLDGIHWNFNRPPTTNSLHSIALPDPNHLWVGGSGGTILADASAFPWACTSVTASVSPPSPSASGTAVTVTGVASGCPNPNYQFWMLAPGSSTWIAAQSYSSSATFAWNTTGLVGGTYRFAVWAADGSSQGGISCNSIGCEDAFAGTSYALTVSSCTSVTAAASPSSPQAPGTAVAISGTASGCPNPIFGYWMLAAGSSAWTLQWPYAGQMSNPIFNWNTTGLTGGTYRFAVWARDAGSAGTSCNSLGCYDAFAAISYTLTLTACTSVTASASPASPQPAGTSVTLTGVASGCPNPLYEVWFLAPGSSTWAKFGGYSSSATLTWNTGGWAGTTRFSVWIRDAGSPGRSCNSLGCLDAYTALTYTVTSTACTSVTASAAPASPQVHGTAVTFTGVASGCPNPQYEFWILAPGSSTWTLARGYSSSATFNWTTTGLAPGTYRFSVWVIDSGSSGTTLTSLGSFDAFVGISYTLT